VVKQLEAGRTLAEMAGEVGGSTYTVYVWKAKFGGLKPKKATKLRHLEDEKGMLKKSVGELALDKEMRKSLLIKNGLSS
jgi:putative transposase